MAAAVNPRRLATILTAVQETVDLVCDRRPTIQPGAQAAGSRDSDVATIAGVTEQLPKARGHWAQPLMSHPPFSGILMTSATVSVRKVRRRCRHVLAQVPAHPPADLVRPARPAGPEE